MKFLLKVAIITSIIAFVLLCCTLGFAYDCVSAFMC